MMQVQSSSNDPVSSMQKAVCLQALIRDVPLALLPVYYCRCLTNSVSVTTVAVSDGANSTTQV